jgi:transcriptional regulator with XRE-family HTH domain
MTTTVRRDELAQFLRSRRERISPVDAGLPPGLRRRTPGLRREEVAQLAGVGVTWYTWLEQGRSINASVQVLDAIARTLRLDRAEREHLYRLADVPTIADASGDCLEPEIQAILDGLLPLPAAVYNGRYDVLAWNHVYERLFPGLTGAPIGERNVLWQLFTMPGCCCSMLNRVGELRAMVANFRAAYGRHLREPAWAAFVDRLSSISAEFVAMWARHDVAESVRRQKAFRHVMLDRDLHLTSTSLAIGGTPEARIVVYTPDSELDRGLLDRIAALPAWMSMCPMHAAAATTA